MEGRGREVEGRGGCVGGEIQRGGGQGGEGPGKAERTYKKTHSHKEVGGCLCTNFNP